MLVPKDGGGGGGCLFIEMVNKSKVTLFGCLPKKNFLYSDGISVNNRLLLYT